MNKDYSPLQHDTEDAPFIEKSVRLDRSSWSHSWGKNKGYALLFALIASLLANVFLFAHKAKPDIAQHENPTPQTSGIANPHDLSTIPKPIHWNTQYSSSNHTLIQALWDRILPSHGFVALDRAAASAANYPESMYLPSDSSKGVYLLGAYHQLHCLKILQRTMHESLTGSAFTWQPGEHIEHCFGYLLQVTVCNAESTHLYTFGKDTAGDGQVMQCRDWDALRRYAAENTACYRDTVEDVLLREHFGYCDDGDDGIEEPRRVERQW